MKKMLAFALICAALSACGPAIPRPISSYQSRGIDIPLGHTPYIPPDSRVTNPNAYGPGVGSDQYGNAVRTIPYY